jgi:glycerate 2-kinase
VRALVAPQAFKGSLPALAVAQAMAAGLSGSWEHDLLPMADGGEGTVDALLAALGGERRAAVVEDPLGRGVKAGWAMLPGGVGAIEMAAASGLPLLAEHERDPRRATTFGTGQLIAAALDSGVSELIVGLGGSATNDGGAFALQALGARLLDSAGKDLPRSVIHLQRLARLDLSGLHARLAHVRLRAMCDVTNPLLGPQGATAVYGPQKGVNPPMRPRLEAALARWADIAERDLAGWRLSDGGPRGETGDATARGAAAVGPTRPSHDTRRAGAPTSGRWRSRAAASPAGPLHDIPGAGAAGGLGFALLALGASLEPGAELILDLARFDERLRGADLVITGEGRLDGQSLFGKATVAVARRAKHAGVPVLAVAGGLGEGWEAARTEGIQHIEPIAPPDMPLHEAQARAAELITAATARALRMMTLGKHASRPGRQ